MLIALSGAHAAGPDLGAACRTLVLEPAPLNKSLQQFSAETGVSIVVDHRLIEGRNAPTVKGASDCEDALSMVVSSAGLRVHKVNAATLAISKPAYREIHLPPISQPMNTEVSRPRDEIIVTGTRLTAPAVHISPVISVGGEEFAVRGITRVEDLLNILPPAFAGQTSGLANGATGTSTLNLRGLGSVRTLVLMDGQRLPYGSPRLASANLDLIPAQLVERVDILTGGASAVYGSDALAGVANFIMRRDFEGFEFDGQVGFYQDGNNNELINSLLNVNDIDAAPATLDGRNVMTSVIIGANTAGGRGNVTAFFSYQDQNEIRQDARDYSTCALAPAAPGPRTIGGVGCIGSSSFRRFFTPMGDFFLEEDGSFSPFTRAPEQTFNFAPENFIQRPIERFSANFFAHYDIADNIEAFLDVGFTENRTDAQIAFSGSFFRPFSVNCDNPFLGGDVSGGTFAEALGCSAAQIADGAEVPLVLGYRNVTGDARNTFIELQTFRSVGGFRGMFGDNWSWDLSGQFARTTQVSVSTGDISFERLQDALLVVEDAAGAPVCRSMQSDCVPFNVFQRSAAGETLVTREAATSVQGTGFHNGETEQKGVAGSLQADLGANGIQSPWAERGIQGLIGAEWREDNLDSRPDSISQLSLGRGLTGVITGIQPVSGQVSVWELFTETQIPIVEGRPFVEEFGINGAYRYSRYSTKSDDVGRGFDTHTFSIGANWAPTPDIRFRGQFQRAVRAPNVIELYTGLTRGQFIVAPGPNGLFDPCASTTDVAPSATVTQCAFTGVTPEQYAAGIPDNPAGVFTSINGGNPLLNPERSNTFTVGVAISPSFLPNLQAAVDYFDITVNDALSVISPQTILEQCIETGDASLCSLIVRDRYGSLFLGDSDHEGVNAVNINIARLKARGVDFVLNYDYDFGDWGVMTWDLDATYMLENSNNNIPGVVEPVECAGFFGVDCRTPQPEYRHRLLTTWRTPWNIDFSATWRYFGEVKNTSVFGPDGTPTDNIIDDTLDAANYLDLAAQWHVHENIILRAGVQNVLGRDPELQTIIQIAPGNGNTFPGTYDPTGRLIFLGINLRG